MSGCSLEAAVVGAVPKDRYELARRAVSRRSRSGTLPAEEVSLDLAAGGFGQRVNEMYPARVGVRGEFVLDELLEFPGEFLGALAGVAEHDKGLDDLAAPVAIISANGTSPGRERPPLTMRHGGSAGISLPGSSLARWSSPATTTAAPLLASRKAMAAGANAVNSGT